MVDDCPMTEDCPAYDRDRGMCLVHPGDCQFSPVDGEAALILETPTRRTPDTAARALPGGASSSRLGTSALEG
jgi:hypothetical protein